ncbi:CoiA-like domain protein [Mesorhizobium australicum]|uniref:competence protein CoiA n=1 Tax=Mesorhizobium australicum TaxID=536018 RepID=UPI003338A9D7
MQYALVDNVRREAFPGGKGNCPSCGSGMVAKCGPRVLHHWAHFGRRNCDPWWENETQWHRDWKNLFPEACREISHVAANGEIHRADVKTPTGIVVEVQHSAMTDAERISRESFYGNLVWVIDGAGFRQNFDIYHLLPDPASDVARDVVWSKAQRHMNGANAGLFFRWSEYLVDRPGATKAEVKSGWIHSVREIEDEVHRSYCGHHQFDWVRPRRTWLDAACPVYIDFGEDFLVKLETYDESGLPCVRRVAKRKFVHDVMVEVRAHAIATRFYPLPPSSI